MLGDARRGRPEVQTRRKPKDARDAARLTLAVRIVCPHFLLQLHSKAYVRPMQDACQPAGSCEPYPAQILLKILLILVKQSQQSG